MTEFLIPQQTPGQARPGIKAPRIPVWLIAAKIKNDLYPFDPQRFHCHSHSLLAAVPDVALGECEYPVPVPDRPPPLRPLTPPVRWPERRPPFPSFGRF